MKKIYLIFISFSLCFSGISATNNNSNSFSKIPENYLNRVVAAIWKIEGGNKTKYPYGIKSIKTNNPKLACEQTVRNNWIRWQKAGKTNDFIQFLGARYAPIGAPDDPRNLNSNWIKNLKNNLIKDKDNISLLQSFGVNPAYGYTNNNRKEMLQMQGIKAN